MSMENRIQAASLAILSSVAVGGALYWLQPVLIPFVLAVFVALGLSPLVDFQTRVLRFPRALALLATLVLVVILFILIAMIVSASVNQLAANAGIYEGQLSLMLERLSSRLPGELVALLPEAEIETLSQIPASSVGNLLAQTTNAILGILSQGFVVFVFVVFLLIGGGQWSRQEEGTMGEIVARVRRYLVVSGVISVTTGVLVCLALMLLNVPLAMVFGLLAFLLNFIPTVGSIIATLLPLPVVIISPDISPTVALLAIAIPGLIQLLIGNIVTPKVLGDSLDLHPVVILMALIFWGMLWGIVGMLLATPITAVLKILLEKFPSSRPLAELLAGRLTGLLVDDEPV